MYGAFCVIFSLSVTLTNSLECYIGYSVLKGSTVGEKTKICEKETDSCYNATAEVTSFSTIQKAGCNTLVCQFNEDKCFERNITGIPMTFCCCKDRDLCNRGEEPDDRSFLDQGAAVLKGMTSFLG
ncbi:unnamed protein product [Cylicocyclus nassatus]|uniref:Uncharacterized protein n=1 Tax=Cylicocyclus nassatus TaxID=53992 RepID=A0AA36LZ31_CYLNA|nr:unnamed protein product [Cylicocyclus nassatus]